MLAVALRARAGLVDAADRVLAIGPVHGQAVMDQRRVGVPVGEHAGMAISTKCGRWTLDRRVTLRFGDWSVTSRRGLSKIEHLPQVSSTVAPPVRTGPEPAC